MSTDQQPLLLLPVSDQTNQSGIKLPPEKAKELFVEYVAEQPCYGSSPAKHCIIDTIHACSSLHISVGSFFERRMLKSVVAPYRGGDVDDPSRGQAPAVWALQIPPPLPFADATAFTTVPHTSVLSNCVQCGSRGQIQCPNCIGVGQITCVKCHSKKVEPCSNCGGMGTKTRVITHLHHHNYHDPNNHHPNHHHTTTTERYTCPTCNGAREVTCTRCLGSGKNPCQSCSTTGWVVCTLCEGFKMVVTFQQVETKWFTVRNEAVVSHEQLMQKAQLDVKSNGPSQQQIRNAPGAIIVEHQGPFITEQHMSPQLPQEAHVQYSGILSQHKNEGKDCRLVVQRLTVKSIPVFKVDYSFGKTKACFWVFGSDLKVIEDFYPHNCLCCHCNLL